MSLRGSRFQLRLSAAILLLVLILFLTIGKANPGGAQAALQTSVPSNLFLPIIFKSFPAQTVFGVEMYQITVAGGLNQVSAAHSTWVRRNAVLWSDIESSPGARNWSAMSALESELLNAATNGIEPILIVRRTPSWAMAVPNSYCGPIKSDSLGAFGNFMRDLVARYSVLPYSVKYWEIWNEPDVAAVPSDNPWGCWGNPSDPYFGGGYYAQMLQTIYPQIKAANPTAQVLVGGLLLDCNPNLPGACSDNRPPMFLEGILLNNGSAYFDGVSFHAYDYYNGAAGQYSNSSWDSYWNTTGPVMIAKANYVNAVLAKYGVIGKFLMNTESALLCDSCTSDPLFETTKAYYVAQAYSAAMASGLRANVWYSVFGWRNSGLLNPDLSPLPAYTAYQFARSELGTSKFVSEITGYPGVKGYAFDSGGHVIWLLWSLDGNSHPIALPNTPTAAWDVFGSPLTSSSSVTIGLVPTYFQW